MSKPYYECRSFNSWVADRLALAGAVGGSGVLLSATWWPRATDLDLRPFGSTAPRLTFDISATTTEESLSILESAMRSTLRDITGHGLRAVIVLQTPLLISPWGGPLYAPDCLFRRSERECAMPLAVHRQLSNKVNQILTKVAGEFPDVRVFDPAPLFAPTKGAPPALTGSSPTRTNSIFPRRWRAPWSAPLWPRISTGSSRQGRKTREIARALFSRNGISSLANLGFLAINNCRAEPLFRVRRSRRTLLEMKTGHAGN